jgi:hypothetical protein
MQSRATPGNTMQTELVRRSSEKHGMQSNENLRNSLGLNYKSAALFA